MTCISTTLIFSFIPFWRAQKCHPTRRTLGRSDYIHAVYEYDDFFISAEAAWFKGSSPFAAGYRFQFEHALVTYENNILKVYEENGNVLESSPQTGLENGINLPSSDAYYNEIRYFADCVLNDEPVSILSKGIKNGYRHSGWLLCLKKCTFRHTLLKKCAPRRTLFTLFLFFLQFVTSEQR